MEFNDKKQIGIRLTYNNYQKLLFLVSYLQSTNNDITEVKKSDVINFAINELFKTVEQTNDDHVKKLKNDKKIDIDLYRDMTKIRSW